MSNDLQWLFLAQKEDMEARAFRDVAKKFAIAVFIGLCLVPFVMPWGAQ